MEFTTFFEACREIFARQKNLPTPTEEEATALFQLTEIMLETNKHMNLTAITEESAVILKHYADSLAVSVLIPEGVRVIDVGCGAGFPTLPLAIFRPDLQITALDATAKRVAYVQQTAKELGLQNVMAIAGRAEELAKNAAFRETFDVATARAVAALPVLSELCLPFVRIGGQFIAMKAARAEEEAKLAKNAIALCGGVLIACHEQELIADDGSTDARTLVEVAKKTSTPSKYPRHFSQISKKPL